MSYQASLVDCSVSLANNSANRNGQRYDVVSNLYLGNANNTNIQGAVFAKETNAIIDEA